MQSIKINAANIVAKIVAGMAAVMMMVFSNGVSAESRTVSAGSASASVQFKIVIPPVLRMNVVAQPMITITQEDIARGYVETTDAHELNVVSNTNREYAVRLDVTGSLVQRATVISGFNSREFGASGISLVQPRPTQNNQARFAFTYRFDLAKGVTPGSYPLPVFASVTQA